MTSYVLTIIGYPASDSIGTFEWGIAGAKGQLLAAGRGTIAGSGTATLEVERLTYHALLAGIQAFLVEDYVGALTITAAPAFIALLQPGDHAEDPDLQRLRQQTVQLLNQVRGKLTLHEQVVVPPLFVEATELARRAAKPLPPRVIAFVTQLNASPGAVTHEDLNRLQIRGTDTYSRIRLPELLPLVVPLIVAQAQAGLWQRRVDYYAASHQKIITFRSASPVSIAAIASLIRSSG